MKAKATRDGSEPTLFNEWPELSRKDALARALDYHREFVRAVTPADIVETAKTFYEFLAGK